MKISINDIKLTPKHLSFAFCVYGKPSEEVMSWANYWGFGIESSDNYTNFIIPKGLDLNDVFIEPIKYEYLDGFSPNINKELHLGHLSNLIIAKSLQSLGISNKTISILGNTLDGTNLSYFDKYKQICEKFGYKIDDIYFASDQVLSDDLLIDGVDEYEGTKVFDIEGEKIVGIKSSGNTTYFYQDVSLAQKLNNKTLYVTGFEQKQHFESLKKLFPHINHVGLGLVLLDGKKMSSSEGNVIFMDELFDLLLKKFDDVYLVYNILAGQILKYSPDTVKNINLNQIDNVKTSGGLYISYTMAKMWSAGIEKIDIDDFTSNELKFSYLKSKINIQPNCLYTELLNHCKKINILYETHYIKDNEDNKKLFQGLTNDLVLSCKKLGLFLIKKV